MARHAHQGRAAAAPGASVRSRVIALIVIVAAAAAIVVLGVWWWTLRHATDPIDADPVTATATVLDSPACTDASTTSVRIPDLQGGDPITADISACGFTDGQRVEVDYLRSNPHLARLAGTSVAGTSGLARTIIPYALLAAGVVIVAAALVMVRERRRRRRSGASAVSVTELRSRIAGDGPTTEIPRPAPDD